MSDLEKLMQDLENEESQELIAAEAKKSLQEQISERIKGGATTGDYLDDFFLLKGLRNKEEQEFFRGIHRKLAVNVGKIVMVVERSFEDTVCSLLGGHEPEWRLRTTLQVGVLEEPKLLLKDGFPNWSIPTAKYYFFGDGEIKLCQGAIQPRVILNWLLEKQLVEGCLVTGPQTSPELDQEVLYTLGVEHYLHRLAICIGDEEVRKWAMDRGKKRIVQVQKACELLQYPLIIHTEKK